MSHYAFCGLSRGALASLSPTSRRSGRRDASPDAAERRRGDRRCRPPKYGLVFTGRLACQPWPACAPVYRRGPRRDLSGRVLHDRPGDRRDQAAAGRTRVRRPATTRPAPAHPAPRVRLRRGRKRHTAHRRRRNPGRRPKAGRPGRAAFVSGKRTQNTITTTTISDGQGRTLWCGAVRPGQMHDQTAMRAEGIAEQFRLCPRVKAESPARYRGLASEFPGQVSAPPRKPKNPGEGAITEQYGWRQARRRHPPSGSPPAANAGLR